MLAVTLMGCTPLKGEADLDCSQGPEHTITASFNQSGDPFTRDVIGENGKSATIQAKMTKVEPGDLRIVLESGGWQIPFSEIQNDTEPELVASNGTYAAVNFEGPQAEEAEDLATTVFLGCSADDVAELIVIAGPDQQ